MSSSFPLVGQGINQTKWLIRKLKYMSLSTAMHWNRLTWDTANSLLEVFKSRLDPFLKIRFNQKMH